MKTLKQILILSLLLVFSSGISLAQHKGHNPKGNKGNNDRDDRHFGLSDSCWKVFLSDLPDSTASKLTGALERTKDIRAKIDSLAKEIRDEREDNDTLAIDSLQDKIKTLRERALDDLKVIREIIKDYHDTLVYVRKNCDSDHKGGTVGLKVTPIVPNPATTKAHFSYTINAEEEVTITIADQLGNIVKHVFDGQAEIGEHDVELDLNGLQPGMYMLRIQAGPDVNTIKLVISGRGSN